MLPGLYHQPALFLADHLQIDFGYLGAGVYRFAPGRRWRAWRLNTRSRLSISAAGKIEPLARGRIEPHFRGVGAGVSGRLPGLLRPAGGAQPGYRLLHARAPPAALAW